MASRNNLVIGIVRASLVFILLGGLFGAVYPAPLTSLAALADEDDGDEESESRDNKGNKGAGGKKDKEKKDKGKEEKRSGNAADNGNGNGNGNGNDNEGDNGKKYKTAQDDDDDDDDDRGGGDDDGSGQGSDDGDDGSEQGSNEEDSQGQSNDDNDEVIVIVAPDITPIPAPVTPEPTTSPEIEEEVEPEEMGTLRVVAMLCAPRPAEDADWEAACTQPLNDTEFEVEALEGTFAGWHRDVMTDDAGEVMVDGLPVGRYALEQSDDDWCRAESDRVDAEGHLVVEVDQVTTVWIFNCDDVTIGS